MNFIIFRDIFGIFLNLFWIYLEFKILKIIFITHIDVVADMAGHRHIATCVHECVCVRVLVCAHVCFVISGLSILVKI